VKPIKTLIETLRQAMQNSTDENIVALEKKLTDKQVAMLRGLYRLSLQTNNQ